MATKTQVVLVDDLTGDPADTTVQFALDKTEYEIDLSDEKAAEMREGLSRYVDAARKVTGGGRPSAQASKPAYTEVFSADWWPTGFSVLKSAGQQPVGRVAA
jgi:hypothetical protein